MKRFWVVVGVAGALAIAGCGPSNAELRTAKTATYNADPRDLFELAVEVAKETYKVGETDEYKLAFATIPRFYSSTGDLESEGAEGWTQVRPGSVQVTLIVTIVPTSEHSASVVVVPHTLQVLSGSPQPRELKPDDPYLPPFVLGRADALALDIYQRAKQFVAAPPGATPGA